MAKFCANYGQITTDYLCQECSGRGHSPSPEKELGSIKPTERALAEVKPEDGEDTGLVGKEGVVGVVTGGSLWLGGVGNKGGMVGSTPSQVDGYSWPRAFE